MPPTHRNSADIFLDNFSGLADGERRGAGSSRRVASERASVRRVFRHPSDRPHGSSAFAVGMLRDFEKKGARP